MNSLLWKEWHEQRWKLGFGCVILSAFALIGLRTRVVPDEAILLWVCFIGVLLLPVLASTGLVPAERADGTLQSMLALPVRPWKILLAKTLMGVLLCAGPLAAAAVVSVIIAGGREITSAAMLGVYARSIAAALSLFIWMYALTIRLPGEARAGLLATGVLIFWLLATAGIAEASSFLKDWPHSDLATNAPVLRRLWVVTPFVFPFGFGADSPAVQLGSAATAAGAIAAQALIAVALWFWAARQLPVDTRARS